MSCSGSTDKYSEVYRGEYPASEPETQTMIAFQEDRKFAKVLDLHSYAEEVRPGYGNHSKTVVLTLKVSARKCLLRFDNYLITMVT
jgi:hypothetical protein